MDLIKAEQLEGSQSNWSFGVIYRCAADPRLIVPLRYTNAAWTPNVAHPRALLVAFAILLGATAPAIIAALLGRITESGVALGAAAWFIVCIVPPGVIARYRSS